LPSALLLSPHLDDVAFSCGGTARRLADAGWRTVLCTVFTRSVPDPRGFALACQLDKGLGPEVDYMALRRAEDADAARHLGAETLWLDLLEAPHRGYGSAPALFGPFVPEDEIQPELEAALEPLLVAGHDLLFAPQAIGGHVDHRRVRDAVVKAGPAARTVWYRDAPFTRSAIPTRGRTTPSRRKLRSRSTRRRSPPSSRPALPTRRSSGSSSGARPRCARASPGSPWPRHEGWVWERDSPRP